MIEQMTREYDIMFLCEHWLRPDELPYVRSIYTDEDRWSYLKSSVDPEAVNCGRPHGGVGFICQKSNDYNFRIKDTKSDRLCVLQLVNDSNVLLTIIGVYMPFYTGSSEQTELYVETLDMLQVFVDDCSGSAPVMIIGDFNTTLPQSPILREKWYRSRPFTQYSYILYEFLCKNELEVANFVFNQKTNYTYFKGKNTSYIDHCLISSHLREHVTSCKIITDLADCCSDHFPIVTRCIVDIKQQKPVLKPSVKVRKHINWSDTQVQSNYKSILSESSSNLLPPICNTDAQLYVDTYCSEIVNMLHESAESAMVCDNVKNNPSKKRHFWWNSSCTEARNRNRFWFKLWCSLGRPRNGVVHETYKYSKYTFRKVCRSSLNAKHKANFKKCSMYFKQNRMAAFWNMIRRSKGNHTDNFDDISAEKLESHFKEKFSYDVNTENGFISEARSDVLNKYDSCLSCYENFVFTEHMTKKYISALKLGCAPGLDGITSEHLKFAMNTNVIVHLCKLFTVCFQSGVVPESFSNGLLVPILKKPTLDPTLPKNYRPITVSSIMSKIIELYIIDECSNYEFNDFQFGFIRGRGTATATNFANDVISYFDHKGSPLFICSLDAEGAYDGIPHPILFKKAIDVIPDYSWKLMYKWYSNMTVQIKWDMLGSSINVSKGTRQGGLTSCFMFNLFYKDMIDELSCHTGGCSIDDMKFNVFCYADDVLLVSTTVTGLQSLINCANVYVTNHGLSFNPGKTKCILTGSNPFTSDPSWYIGENVLETCNNIQYLGAYVGNKCNDTHVECRISACRKSFYALQGAGLCKQGLDVKTAVHVFKSVCRSGLAYACETMYLSKSNRNDLDKCQSKLLKCMLGLNVRCRTTYLLEALNVHKVTRSIDFYTVSLLNNVLRNQSGATGFYLMLMKKQVNCPKLLTCRAKSICNEWGFNHLLSAISQEYLGKIKKAMLSNINDGQDGVVDSIRLLLNCDMNQNDFNTNSKILQLLLRSF
jgi:exonuclease III